MNPIITTFEIKEYEIGIFASKLPNPVLIPNLIIKGKGGETLTIAFSETFSTGIIEKQSDGFYACQFPFEGFSGTTNTLKALSGMTTSVTIEEYDNNDVKFSFSGVVKFN